MKWSIRLGRFAGIDVYLHLTFLLLVAVLGWMFWKQSHTVEGVLRGVGFYLSLFGCVLLHEYGHALTARRFGVETRDITLLPIGGVARMDRMPDKPMQEFWVAIAGPAVNVVIAALILLWLAATGELRELKWSRLMGGPFLHQLMAVNLFLVAFNMLPAFPMDGGRVLRSLLALRLDYVRATQIAAGLGQVMALVFAFVGFTIGPVMLFFIAFFVWIGASQESGMAQVKSSLSGTPVSDAMLRDFRTLEPDDSLQHAVELILAGSQQDFPVTAGGDIVGVLARSDLMAALAKQGAGARVGEVMDREFPRVEADELLESAFARLQDSRCGCLPVMEHGRMVGLLTAENVGEFIMIREALRSNSGRSKPPLIRRAG